MRLAPNDLLLLDTSVLVHWIRQDRTGQLIQREYQLHERLERPLLSTITEGEIWGLAKCWRWGEKKIDTLGHLLRELVRVEAGSPEIVEAYAELYCESQRRGWNIGENDLWIAACTKATRAILLTCDYDFLRLSPHAIHVEHIASRN